MIHRFTFITTKYCFSCQFLLLTALLLVLTGCDPEPKQKDKDDKSALARMSVQVSEETRASLPTDESDGINKRYIKEQTQTDLAPLEDELLDELADELPDASFASIDEENYESVTINEVDISPDEPDLYHTQPTEELQQQLVSDAQIKQSLQIRFQYKKRFNPLQKTIAIVVDDIGVDQARSLRATELEGIYTLAFLPYGKNLQHLTQLADRNGHEIFLHQGAEPTRKLNPGPDALTVGMEEETIKQIIDNSLEKLPLARGINNHMGSKFAQWHLGMNVLVEETYDRGLIFLDSFTHKSSQGLYLAQAKNYPALARDVFIDGEKDPEWIKNQLKRAERIAIRDGFAIAIGHPHDTSLMILPEWQKELQMRGFKFVTISQLWSLLTKPQTTDSETINPEKEPEETQEEIIEEEREEIPEEKNDVSE